MLKKPEFTDREELVIDAVDKHDILGANLASLNQIRLTHEQNVKLGEEIQEDLAASRRKSKIKPKIDELALRNAGLAIKPIFDLASQVGLTETDLADCLQNSLINLWKAARKYDPWFEKEPTGNPEDAVRFSSIAVPYIMSGLTDSEPEFQTITLPKGMAGRARRYEHEYDFREQSGDSPDHLEISKIVAQREGLKAGADGLPTIAKNLQLALNARKVASLDDPFLINFVAEDSGEPIQIKVDRGELLPGQTPDFEEVIANRVELKKEVHRALQVLTDREREVLELRFGLKDGLSRTCEETGHHFRLKEDRIRQIEAKALRKLRHPARSGSLREYL